jgi:hypothetical protein
MKFKYSVQGPCSTQTMTHDLFATVPIDVIAKHIFSHCMDKWSDFATLSLVSRRFHQAACVADDAHQRLFLAQWPVQSARLKFAQGGWMRMAKRRAAWEPGLDEETPIEGCEVIFRCPMKFDDLPEAADGNFFSPNGERRRTCHECNKEVVQVSDKDRAIELAASGSCVSFKRKPIFFDEPWMGLMMAPEETIV